MASNNKFEILQTCEGTGLKAVDIQHLLRQRLGLLSGGRDRWGRPIIVFPSREGADKTSPEDLRLVLLYLHAIPSDETKESGFVVLIDMRQGMTWNGVKPILKTLQDHFPGNVHAVYIIKPEKFWEKQRANIASAKYKFEVHMISLEGITKFIDPSQLTADFDGHLIYDHEDWLELRVALEDLIWRSLDVLRVFDTMKEEMENGQMPIDVDTARSMSENHGKLWKKIGKAPVDQLETEGQKLIHRLSGASGEEGSAGGADSDYGSGGRDSQVNPDFAVAAPHITSLLHRLRETRQKLYLSWQTRKKRLDQCFQLKLFEQDADKMFEWIRQHIELFLSSYAEIGKDQEEAKRAQMEHDEFSRAADNTYVSIQHIMTVAERLLEAQHYAAPRIQAVATRLERDWKLFTRSLETRGAVLSLSAAFHFKAAQYSERCEEWLRESMGVGAVEKSGEGVEELEAGIHRHQQLMDGITRSYTEIHSTSKKLLYHLDRLVQLCLGSEEGGSVPIEAPSGSSDDGMNSNGKALIHALRHPPMLKNEEGTLKQSPESLPLTPDYTAGATHVLEVIHGLLAKQRQIEQAWQQRRVRLHQRLALVLFQQDVRQVLDWLDNHGESFLKKNLGIGISLQRARQLQKSQQHFENVARNTYSNAEKLIVAAEELGGTGECRPEEVYGVASELKKRIAVFTKQVQARKHLLNLSVLFHTHHKEMMAWYDEVSGEQETCATLGPTFQECERKKETWLARTEATRQAYATALGEGQQLVCLLRQQAVSEKADNSESISCVEGLMVEIERRHTTLLDKWQKQRLQLQMGSEYRLFEQDCQLIRTQLEGWMEDMRQTNATLTPSLAESVMPLHQENTAQVHAAMIDIMCQAEKQIQVLTDNELNILSSKGEKVSEMIVGLAKKIRSHEQDVMRMAENTETRLEQALQLGRFQATAADVADCISNEERVLAATLAVPTSADEADRLQKENNEFQMAIERTNHNALALQEKAEQMLASNHFDPARVTSVAEDVLTKWRRLVGLMEERYKLLTAASTYYKTLDQVIPVLENLERDYMQERDWCSLYSRQDPTRTATDKLSFVSQLLSKHMDNKERFLKGCTYARKNSDLFLKFVRRTSVGMQVGSSASVQQAEAFILDTLDSLRKRENQILHLWTKKKKQLDQCQQYVLLEASAKNVLDWLHDEGEVYLDEMISAPAKTEEQIQKTVETHVAFKATLKERKEKVKLFLGVANNIITQDSAPIHEEDIKQWMGTVQERFQDFVLRIDKFEKGIGQKGSNRDLRLDRQSDPNLEAKIGAAAQEMNESKRKSLRHRENVMAEILNTERAYVKDLEECITHYMSSLSNPGTPAEIRGKQEEIFCNLQNILGFHRDVFLKELIKYESLPEDLGHCFVSWQDKFHMYVTYCLNKEKSNQLLAQPKISKFFDEVQKKNKLNLNLSSYLIKPVQRITKYQLLLKDLCQEMEGGQEGELKEAMEVMLNVPRRANDIMHLNVLDGCSDKERLGEVLLQDNLMVWDPRPFLKKGQLLKKGRERQVFLFDLCVVFSKKDDGANLQGKLRYTYKHRLMLSEINISEHIEGDECKFALWTGTVPTNEYRTILRASDHKTKLNWVRKLRDLIGTRILHLQLPQLRPLRKDSEISSKEPDSVSQTTESSNEYYYLGGQGGEDDRRASVHSITSNASLSTLPEKVHTDVRVVREDYTPSEGSTVTTPISEQVSVVKGQRVEVLERLESEQTDQSWFLVRVLDNGKGAGSALTRQGLVPSLVLAPPEESQPRTGSRTSSTGISLEETGTSQTASNVMKRKSLKRLFTGGGSNRNSGKDQDQLAGVSEVPGQNDEKNSSNRNSVYRKWKLNQASSSDSSSIPPGPSVTPPLASEEDLPEHERVSSKATPTPLSESPSWVLSAGAGVSADEGLPQDIEIPPPMDSIASGKLLLNGQNHSPTPDSKVESLRLDMQISSLKT